jgi:acetyl esterase/lipase
MKFLLCAALGLVSIFGAVQKDISYAPGLGLDLYLPAKQAGPLIVYVHGGAWRSGSKNEMPLGELVESGCPVASVDYRLSTVARFPAQVHDIKAAIRFLRARQEALNIDASRVVIAGSSAGGHLAALVGVTNGDKRLEGEVGEYLKESSALQGIISFYGGSDLTTILSQSTPKGLEVRKPALDLFLGDQPEKVEERARLASPVFHVDKNDPPLLLFHGDRDPQMPINQAHQLQGTYEKAGLKARLKVLHEAGHGGKVFYEPEQMATVKEFLAGLGVK